MRLFFLFTIILATSQSIFYTHESDFESFQIDNLKQIYILSEDGVSLADPSGNIRYRYSSLKNGTISTMDQVSALRTMVFYKDQSAFILLDNTLSEVSALIRLDKLDLHHISLMCVSENNNYWCYSREKNAVIRINQRGDIISTGSDLNQLLNKVVAPSEMIEHGDRLYLHDPKNGVHVFDSFGSYEKTLPIIDAAQISLNLNFLYYLKNNSLFQYDINQHLEKQLFKIEAFEVEKFAVEGDHVYFMDNRNIYRNVLDK